MLVFRCLEKENSYWDTRERFRTNDSDFFDVYYKFASEIGAKDFHDSDGEGLVIIAHGLNVKEDSDGYWLTVLRAATSTTTTPRSYSIVHAAALKRREESNSNGPLVYEVDDLFYPDCLVPLPAWADGT